VVDAVYPHHHTLAGVILLDVPPERQPKPNRRGHQQHRHGHHHEQNNVLTLFLKWLQQGSESGGFVLLV
jgi:hypothetical protein